MIDNICVENVTEFNFLGLTLNENLNWKSHIDKLADKVSQNIGIMNKLKNYMTPEARLNVYNSLILSHLNYGILL